MRKMFLFMMVSLDGFMEGPGHDLSWHNIDEEFNTFAAEQMKEMGTIVFGRKTYQLMENYWPSAKSEDPYDAIVAEQMNTLPKVVVSKSLDTVVETENWQNILLVKDNIADEIKKLKENDGKPIAVLGSNNLCITLLELGLLDELRIMINPVVLGEGTRLFAGLKNRQKFILTKSREFNNGNVLLYYQTKSS